MLNAVKYLIFAEVNFGHVVLHVLARDSDGILFEMK